MQSPLWRFHRGVCVNALDATNLENMIVVTEEDMEACIGVISETGTKQAHLSTIHASVGS